VTDPLPAGPDGGGVVRLGLDRFRRLFNVIVGAFGVLYTLQTADSFVADLPTAAGPWGVTVLVLVLVAVLAGLVPIVSTTRARTAFIAGTVLYAVALLLWPLTVRAPIPADPVPWLVAVWPAPAAYAAQASRTRRVPIVGAVAFGAFTATALRLRGLDTASALGDGLFMAGIAIVLILLLHRVRRGVVSLAKAQQDALARFAETQDDDATETERKRTDALLHDAVLTTFLSAAAARTPEDEDLAGRMAGNALRVLLHVNGVGHGDAVMPFGQALLDEREVLDPLLLRFEVDLGPTMSIMLPEEVARAIVAVLLQAVRNSVQHAHGARRRTLRAVPLGPDGIRVVVEDDGCGFDPATVEPGAGAAAVRALRALEGRADVRTAVGGGTGFTVSWGSVVMVGTDLVAEAPLRAGA
jgi:signal transduction histidine kinase